jgi:hypothetical protein
MAQDSGLNVSVGARLWYAKWTTFSYLTDNSNPPQNLGLTQISASPKLVVIPLISARYDNFFGSFSAFPSTTFTFDDGSTNTRQEFDANVGYSVLPGLLLTLGYKKVSQTAGPDRYRPAGPLIGVAGNAPLAGPWSLYGSLGVGKLKTPSGDKISFKADYHLAEVGVAYTISGGMGVQSWTCTGGYRIQVMNSQDALPEIPGQDGVDTTQGFSLGVIATF